MDFAWQCKCGNIEYDSFEPEECLSCGKIGSFAQVPEELLAEREKDSSIDELDLDNEIEHELSIEKAAKTRPSKTKSLKSKKPSLDKPKRRNKRK
ncbi:hypothetical protein J4217_04890 [Candidatus Pacearchaeota archaeon]|nr:hypothetical protein [Candidatus Pacearchaeota archaeon]